MPLPSSGKITTQTFRDFFEIDANTPISSSDWYRGGPYVRANYQSVNGNRSINNQVPTSGRITLSDLYGAYKVVPANNITPGNTENYSPTYPDATVDPGQFPDTSSDTATSDPFANPPSSLNSSDLSNNPPNPDWGAGPAGAYQDPNPGPPTSPDAALPPALRDPYPSNNQNPPTGNNDYTYYTPGNTNNTVPGDGPGGPPVFGDASNNPTPGNTNPGNWTYGNPKSPGNYNPNSSDQGTGPAGPSNSQDYTPTPQTGPDSSAAPSVRDSYWNPNNTTNPWDVVSPNPTTNPPYWIDHEKLV